MNTDIFIFYATTHPVLSKLLKRIKPYPTTNTGADTVNHHIIKSADKLYDDWVCDRRWEPEDVVRLLEIACIKRGYVLKK